jgi:general L-amino acid transport system permease protein
VQRTGRPGFNFLWVVVAFVAVPVIGWLIVPGNPLALDVPVVKGLRVKGGTVLSPEFVALTLGLVVYTGAFIAEVVRAGILAVPKGQTEAARAQWFTNAQILRLIVLPQALRVIIPPLISQYLNLTKNSSLALGIGFLDLYAVSHTMLNQSGRVVEVFLMIMASYLTMSLTISFIMNVVNQRIQIVER